MCIEVLNLEFSHIFFYVTLTSLERFYSYHLRSLFISKFKYFDARAVKLLGGMRWTFIAKPSYFSMLMLLVFFTTGRWPSHKRLQRSQRMGKHSTSLMALTVTYSHTFSRSGLQLLQKCKFFHFPDIDSSTVVSDFLFEMVFVNRYVLYSNWQLIVPTLLELEGIFEGQIGLAQRCAKSIFFRCYFRSPFQHSLYFLQTTIRALQVPFTTSTRFLSALDNSHLTFSNIAE